MKTIQNSCPFIISIAGFPSFLRIKNIALPIVMMISIATNFVQAQTRPEYLKDQYLLTLQPMTISDGCEEYISVSGTNSVMESKKFILVERGMYTYQLKIVMNPDGALGTIYSEKGERFNPDDELVFINSQNARIALRLNAVTSKEDQSIATFPINEESVKWFGAYPATVIYLKNNVKNQMLKFTIKEERQTYFFNTMKCFLDMMY